MIGLDLGSTRAKAVKVEDGKIVERKELPSPRWRELLDMVEEGEAVASTGYFRHQVNGADAITELTAARWGVRSIAPDSQVIVDIGGQDTKVQDLRTNRFVLNDKCSAGTGAFLELVASYFGKGVEDLADMASEAREPVEINSTCAVFAMSEMVSQLVGGASQADVVAGMHRAFARRIAELVPDAPSIVVIGGGARNEGLVGELTSIIGADVLVPENPEHVNALGAVLYAQDG
ncbi:MAG: 2-hydroxyglutaryl-CoA dehydratase [Thermoplasmata archaeon]|nr:MAG: 2-hydroxyglutaryl-CoA dehydratase [Thermoplasmata archaeon]